jgi:hypothetical protein
LCPRFSKRPIATMFAVEPTIVRFPPKHPAKRMVHQSAERECSTMDFQSHLGIHR